MVESNKMMVIKQIIRVVEFFLQVTGQKMEKFQIQVLAGDLRDAFSTDTLDDVILMFKMARKGECGKVYGKIDYFTIMEWVPQYMAQKSLVREQLIQRQKNARIIKLRERVEMPEEIRQKFDELLSGIQKRTLPKKESFEVLPHLRTMDAYLAALPESSTKLTRKGLEKEIQRVKYTSPEAYEILLIEKERRRQSAKQSKNETPHDKD